MADKGEQDVGLPAGQTGQIKIDLSIEEYDIVTLTVDGRRPRERLQRRKNPSLSSIMSVLKNTGARVLRISGKGVCTVIDYTA